MKRFVEGEDRRQGVLLPEYLDDYISEDNPVRVIDVFVDELDLRELGFEGVVPELTGRPAYHPATLLKVARKGAKPERIMIDATHLKAHRTAASLLKRGLFPDVSGARKAA